MKVFAKGLFLSFILTACFSFSAQAQSLEEGMEAFNKGQYNEAINIWTLAMEKTPDPKIKTCLAYMHIYGRGFGENAEEGVRLLKEAADEGNPVALFNLGFLYLKGHGVDKQSEEEAAKYFQLAATKGFAPALCNLAKMHTDGRAGFTKDDRTAIELFERAAKADLAEAHFYLSLLYKQSDQVASDQEKAIKHVRRAAELWHPQAQLDLARHYVDGEGVERDMVQALMWADLSANNNGQDEATELRQQIMDQMREEDIELAQKMSQEKLKNREQ